MAEETIVTFSAVALYADHGYPHASCVQVRLHAKKFARREPAASHDRANRFSVTIFSD